MTRIRDRCPNCKTTNELDLVEIILRRGPTPGNQGIRWICATCDARIDHYITLDAFDILAVRGATVVEVTTTGDVVPNPELPVTMAEVLAFVYELAQTDTPQIELIDQ